MRYKHTQHTRNRKPSAPHEPSEWKEKLAIPPAPLGPHMQQAMTTPMQLL